MLDIHPSMNKVYLDQVPELYGALRKLAEGLDLDVYGYGCENWIRELECRPRDGFIPRSYNHGGFDSYNILESIPGESEDDDGTLVFHGFRFMYEGSVGGIHTVCVYYCSWDEHDIYGISRAPTRSELKVTSRSVQVLIRKLTKFCKAQYRITT